MAKDHIWICVILKIMLHNDFDSFTKRTPVCIILSKIMCTILNLLIYYWPPFLKCILTLMCANSRTKGIIAITVNTPTYYGRWS